MIAASGGEEPGPPSPCNKVCSIDRRTGWCLGCFRSGEEIGAWPALAPEAKRALLARLAERQRQAAAMPRS